MNLTDYLNRINYSGALEPTTAVLFALHRAHLAAIAYENLDIHLGVPVTVDLAQIYDKIVNRGRGGWCFEMNGLFAWVLKEIGFDVTMYAATVDRAARTNDREGDHLVLKVELDQPYLADVGFGTGFFEPLPLVDGQFQQDFLTVGLRYADVQHGQNSGQKKWHFENAPKTGPGYDFPLVPQALSDFGEACTWLQTSPISGFVRSTVCHRVQKGMLRTMRGLVYSVIQPSETTTRVVEDASEYRQIIQNEFGLPINETDQLWETASTMHQRWLAANPM